MSAPIAWTWDGEVMRPMRRFIAQADRELVVGERYLLEPVDEAQSARDKAYHAEMRRWWMQLPHGIAELFPNPKDFRRHCLIECGFCDVDRLAFASADAAGKALKLLAKEGAEIGVNGAVVVVKTAWSQRMRGGMTKETRMRSYQETQDYAASLVGASPDDVARHGEAA